MLQLTTEQREIIAQATDVFNVKTPCCTALHLWKKGYT